MSMTNYDTSQILRKLTAGNWRTSPRPKTPEEATDMVEMWTEVFNLHGLSYSDVRQAVVMFVSDSGDAPQPSDLVKIARRVRRDRVERDPALKERIAARNDARNGHAPQIEAAPTSLVDGKAEALRIAREAASRKVNAPKHP